MIVVGLLGALLSAEGLNRLSALVGAFKGTDAPFYQGMLVVSVIAAGTLLVSLFHPVARWLKVLLLLGLLACGFMMSFAPNFPVAQQIIAGIAIAFLGALAVPTPKKTESPIAS